MHACDLLPGLDSVAAFARAFVTAMKPRVDLMLENLALRQQIAVLKRKLCLAKTRSFAITSA